MGVALLLALVFVPLSFLRLVDGDEGAYLIAARLVMEGKLPFLDFFYPQMFLLPYIYGLWMALFGFSWYTARMLSGLFTIILGVLLYAHVAGLTRRAMLGIFAAAFFAFSSLAIGWYPVVKTYPVATLLIFAAYVVFASMRSPWARFLSGMLLGLAVDVRLYCLVLAPVFALYVLLEETRPTERRRQLVQWGAGLALALLPNLTFVTLDPDVFLFNVVGIHAIRSDFGLVGLFSQKLEIALGMLGIGSREPIMSLQFTCLLIANVALLAGTVWRRERPPLSLAITGVLISVSLVPTPAYTQYFAMVLPFLVVDAMLAIAMLERAWADRAGASNILTPALLVVATAYVAISPAELHRYTFGGTRVPGVYTSDNAVNWSIPTIRAVERAIDREVEPSNPFAISWWPGYFIGTRASILPRLENHFILEYAQRLTLPQMLRYNFITYGGLVWNIQHHTVDVIVLGNWVFREAPVYRRLLGESGYVKIETIRGTEIYKLRAKVRAARGP